MPAALPPPAAGSAGLLLDAEGEGDLASGAPVLAVRGCDRAFRTPERDRPDAALPAFPRAPAEPPAALPAPRPVLPVTGAAFPASPDLVPVRAEPRPSPLSRCRSTRLTHSLPDLPAGPERARSAGMTRTGSRRGAFLRPAALPLPAEVFRSPVEAPAPAVAGARGGVNTMS